ncbi:MAG: PEP-CTERM sorting domain-containing protein [Chthoniobacteraceae bacterium]
MNRKIAILVCALASAARLNAASVTWGSQETVGFALGPGVLLAQDNLVQVGVFDVPLATVEANANNLGYLFQHFQVLDTARVARGATDGFTGYGGSTFNIDTRASQNALGGQLLYVWAFNSTVNTTNPQNSRDTATQYALLTLNTSAWTLPTDPDPGAPGTVFSDVNQLTTGDNLPLQAQARLIAGTFPVNAAGAGGTNHFGLVNVPEPSTGLMLSLGLLALVRRRR